MDVNSEGPAFDPESPRPAEFLLGVREAVAIANSGGGIVQISTLHPASPLRAADLAPARVQELINPFVGPGGISIRRVVRSRNTPGELMLFVDGAKPYPLIFRQQGTAEDGGPAVFDAGEIYVRDAGRAVRADYKALVEHFDQTARTLFNPESATALLDVTLARRSRNLSALLDGMDLLWCLIERDHIDLTPARADLLLRGSLRRTPTLFFWLAQIADHDLVEDVLLSSLEDEDRDSSDAKDSILEVAALIASSTCIDEVLSRLRTSRYAHFRQAAGEWGGRRAALLDFERRVEAARVDGDLALDLPVPALLNRAEELARQIIAAGSANPALSRSVGDIGRVIYFLQSQPRED